MHSEVIATTTFFGAGEKDGAPGPGHDVGEDGLGPEHGVEERRRLAHDLVGDREAAEAAALLDHLEEGLHPALVADVNLVSAHGDERGVPVGDQQGSGEVEVGGIHVFNPPSRWVNFSQRVLYHIPRGRQHRSPKSISRRMLTVCSGQTVNMRAERVDSLT